MFPKIFSGVKVLDFSRLLPGPFASELLIKMGAEVKCVVPPKGDPLLGEYSPFNSMRWGKTFEKKDLKDPLDLKEVQAWASQSQILLEGFRPGTMKRLGLGFDEVKVLNPKILYVSISGYTSEHPKYLKGAHDLNFLIDAGIYSLLYPDDSDDMPVLQLADVFGGFFAAFQILGAWLQRGERPRAQHLQISIVEGLELLPQYLKDPKSQEVAQIVSGGAARYKIYWTRDKKRLMVGAIEGKFFQNLMKVLGLNYGPHEEGPEIQKAIQNKFSEKTLSEWKRLLEKEDVCVSFIPSREESLRP